MVVAVAVLETSSSTNDALTMIVTTTITVVASVAPAILVYAKALQFAVKLGWRPLGWLQRHKSTMLRHMLKPDFSGA